MSILPEKIDVELRYGEIAKKQTPAQGIHARAEN